MLKTVSLPVGFDTAHLSSHKQSLATLLIVILCHLMILWLLMNVSESYRLDSPPVTKAIQVKFVSLSKSSQTIEQDSSAATVTAQPTVNTTTPQPIIKKPAQQPILSSTDATKKIQQTPPKAQIKAVATPQQVTQPSTTTTNATPAATGTGNAVQGTSKQNGGSEQGTAQHNTPTTSSNTVAEPTRLNASQVTVLSIGQINYNDKALQNQNRLLILTLQIDSKGKPTQIRIKQSSGLDYLDQLVIKAAQKARFKPHIVNGQAVAVIVDYPFQLNLSQR